MTRPTTILNSTNHQRKSAIPISLQQKAESSLGHDFSQVKVHQNSNKAVQLQAKAFAKGNDIHFAPGQFNPGTSAGKTLIGHELAHVAQQREGKVQQTMQQNTLGINNDIALEREADTRGSAMLSGSQHMRQRRVTTPGNFGNVIQRDLQVEGGSKKDKESFLKKINKNSGIPFEYDETYHLQKKNEKDTAKKVFAKRIVSSIKSSEFVKLELTSKDDRLFIDSYPFGTVDMADIMALSDDVFQNIIVHILAERFATMDYDIDQEAKVLRKADFKKAHKVGIAEVEKLLREKYPKKTIKFKEKREGFRIIDSNTGNGEVETILDYTDVHTIIVQSVVKHKTISDVIESRIDVIN